MNEEKKYFAFISYSHKDKKVAKKLQNFIQGYKIPAKLEDRPDLPKRIGKVFRDEDELVGDELTPQIEEALRQSRYLIVVCSPNSAKSKYVNEEIEYFKSLGGETKILPYIIAGKATTDEDPECCYAPALRENQKKHQIVGGDAQENGAEAASVKLIAGMLKLEFNTLYDRFRKAEKRKRKIVITVITAFALLMAGVTAWILFLYKDVQESKSVILAENAMNRIEKGDYLGARRTALEAITLSYSPEAEAALRQSWESNSAILEGHSYSVRSVCWSPDGKYLASGSGDKTVIIWDAKSGEIIKTLEGHSSVINSVSWSPDGKYLASGSMDKTIILWDAKSGQRIKTLKGHSSDVLSVSWSHDGKYLASGSQDSTLIIWDVNSGACLKTLEGHYDWVYSVCWSPDGKYLASGSSDNTVKIWEANSGAKPKTLYGHSDYVTSVCWSPDGKYLASGSMDKTIILWDAKSGQRIKTLKGHSKVVYSVCWSPDGKYLASGSADKTVILWDAKSGQRIKTLEGHSNRVTSVCWSPDGNYLASGSADRTVGLWELYGDKKYSVLDSMPENIYSSIKEDNYGILSPNGKYGVYPSRKGDYYIGYANSIKIYENSVIVYEHLEETFGKLISFTWSPDGKYLIGNSDDGMFGLWNAKSGLFIQTFEAHNAYVDFVGFTSDGRKIISTDTDGGILQWDFPPLDELIEKTKKWAGK